MMKKQDFAKLAILGMMGVAASVHAQNSQNQPAQRSVQGQQSDHWEPTYCDAQPVSAYNNSGDAKSAQTPAKSGQETPSSGTNPVPSTGAGCNNMTNKQVKQNR